MMRAVTGEAAGGQAHSTDLATLRRVAEALRGQMGGTLPVMPLQPAVSACCLDRRTFALLRHARTEARQP